MKFFNKIDWILVLVATSIFSAIAFVAALILIFTDSDFRRFILEYWEYFIFLMAGVITARYFLIYLDTPRGEDQIVVKKSDLERKIRERLLFFADRIRSIEETQAILSKEDKDKLVDKLKEGITDDVKKTIIRDVTQETSALLAKERASYLSEIKVNSINRLNQEVRALSRRGNMNLFIGIVLTIAGFFILGVFVLSPTYQPTPDNFFESFISRVSLVILIEVFALFFLGLYKTSLNEIKYFQNEITNIEHKYSSLEYALQFDQTDTLKELLLELGKTERNFVLQKGESTVMMAQSKINSSSLENLATAFLDLVKRKDT